MTMPSLTDFHLHKDFLLFIQWNCEVHFLIGWMYSGQVLVEPGIINRLCSRVPLLKKLATYDCINQSDQYVAMAQSNQWVSLTDLTISHLDGITPTYALLVLAETPQLRSTNLKIQIASEYYLSFTESRQVVHLAFLKKMCLSLTIRSNDHLGEYFIQNGVVQMFDTIHCPSLTSLSFSMYGFPFSEIPFTSLPLDHLETLELEAVMSSKALYHCLTLVPSLLSLQIRDIGSPHHIPVDIADHNSTPTVDESVLLALSHGGAESDGTDMPLCPKLQNFRLFPSSLQKISNYSAALTTFITSRMKTLKLCEALFPFQDSFAITNEDLGRLKAVKESGMMNLRLHYSSPPPPREDEQDLPTMGLSQHVHDTPPLMPRRQSVLSDMEGYWGTGIII
ncbi:hypothetical protein BT96DRAFT_475724 [Gymnopus androsaceus JB14]|uniref:Uncharacterized protein n=1 Tax=Gymnopus androsaceus JB14 TaxID=1447944 RepID=A0A6A4GQP6_9AGAR|nr:hypothetical protein BT96DRAFT_475724 [Gymnopus androsaceus JB14]